MKKINYKKLLVFNTIFVGIVGFLFFIFYVENLSIISEKHFYAYAKNIESKMVQGMLSGKKGDSLKEFLKKEIVEPNTADYKVYRAKPVVAQHGLGISPPEEALQAEKTITPILSKKMNSLSYYFPVIAEAKCIECHTQTRVGEVMGVININENELINKDFLLRFSYYFTLIFLFSILMFFILEIEIKNFFVRNIKNTTKNIEKIKHYYELETLSFLNECFTKTCPEELFNFFKTYQEKLRELSFDKKLMNFQIELLQKFMITKTVIDNWIDYLKHVFLDLNTLVSLNVLYSVSKIDNYKFEVVIVWKNLPSKQLKEAIEKEIALKFQLNQNILLLFHHEIISSTPFIDESLILEHSISKETDNLKVNMKTLVLNEPCIGGFVGIGFDDTDKILNENEKLKYIMLENVLSVLINLIGSIKTISSYVNDINNLATRDGLTSLLNRRVFYEMADKKIKAGARRNKIFCLVFVDVDNFKIINDNYGHAAGDMFLKNMAQILEKNTREEDIVARFGGDEFVIVVDNSNIEQTKVIINRIQTDVENLKKLEENNLPKEISLSIGIVEYPTHGTTIDELVSIADEMMYSGKKDGKNRIICCDEDLMESLIQQNKIKKDLVFDSIKNSSLIPYFQKIENPLNSNEYIYELLMRIQVANTVLTANEFIEIAENTRLINELDLQLFNKALKHLSSIHYQGKLFVNISPKSLMAHNYISKICAIVEENNFKYENIVFEITERDTVKNIVYLEHLINELTNKGFQFALDDFGSGFSSFIYLKKFNISYLKIDGYFINNICNNSIDLVFIKSIIYLAKELNIKLVAEFVETKEVYDLLIELGIDYVQGYYIHIPSDNLLMGDKDVKKLF